MKKFVTILRMININSHIGLVLMETQKKVKGANILKLKRTYVGQRNLLDLSGTIKTS